MNQEIIKCPNYSFAKDLLSNKIHQCLTKAQNVLILGPIPNSGTKEPDGSYTHHIYYQKLKNYLIDIILTGKSLYNSRSIDVLAQDTTLVSNFTQNIVITSAYDLFNNEMIINDNEPWFRNLGLVIFENITEFITFNRHWQGLISHLLYNFASFDIIYLTPERAKLEDGIRSEFDTDSITQETSLNNDNQPIGFLYFTSWNRENTGRNLQFKWTDSNIAYAGMETMILYKANKLNASNFYSLNYSRNVPYEDYIEEIEREHNTFRENIDINYIQFQKNIDKRFIATDDLYNNLSYSLYRHRLPRNGKMYINICSTPYLFRDYMAANIAYFNEHVLYPLSPIVDRNSKRSTLLFLSELLRRNPLSRKRICEFLNESDSDTFFNDLLEMYNKEFSKSLKGILIEQLSIKTYSSSEMESQFVLNVDSDFWLDERTQLFKVIDSKFQSVVFDTIPKDLLVPYFTSKEQFCYREKSFKVDRIDFTNRQVLMEKDTRGTSSTENVYYSKSSNNVQISSNTNKGTSIQEKITNHKTVSQRRRVSFALCDIIVESLSIEPLERYDFSMEYDYSKALIISKSNLQTLFVTQKNNDDDYLVRKYNNEKVLFMYLKIVDSKLFLSSDHNLVARLSATLTYMLKQVLESFLPDSFMFLDVLCLNKYDHKDEYHFISKVNYNDDHFEKDAINIAIIEDAIQDMGLLKAVKENFNDILLYLDDYLQWYLSQGEELELDDASFKEFEFNQKHFISRNQKIETIDQEEGIQLKIEEVEFGYEGEISDKVPKKIKTDLLKINDGRYPSFFELDLLKKIISLKIGDNNSITQKRIEYLTRKEIRITNEDGDSNHQCDFCGKEVAKEELSIIKDGRERCSECSLKNPWDKKEEITADINEHINLFFLKIGQKKPVTNLDFYIVYTNVFNKTFTPTRFFDPRAIGLAVFKQEKNVNSFDMYVENGMPEKQSILTMIHEWTHIWQYNNLDYYKMNHDYNKLLIEGHTTWAEVYYAAKIKKWGSWEYWENLFAPPTRNDEYGNGYRLIKRMMKKHNFIDPFKMLLELYPGGD